MSTKIEDEQVLVNQLQKKIKELQVKDSLLTSDRADIYSITLIK